MVVVDAASGRLVETGVDGLFEVGDVEDEGGGVAVLSRTDSVDLIELIVEEQPLHVIIDDPSLVGVLVTVFTDTGQHLEHSILGHLKITYPT